MLQEEWTAKSDQAYVLSLLGSPRRAGDSQEARDSGHRWRGEWFIPSFLFLETNLLLPPLRAGSVPGPEEANL